MAKDTKEETKSSNVIVPTQDSVGSKCPDCNGEGIKSPVDHQVCQTCQGTGKA